VTLVDIDSSLLIAAGASFVAGLLGYTIVRMWVRPVLRYTMGKRRLERELTRYQAHINSADRHSKSVRPKPDAAALKAARKQAMQLVTCYNKEIPYWYRLLLDSRQESPAEASGLLTNLSKIRGREAIDARMAKVRQSMRLRQH
jgi:hypothetical protein